MAKWVCNVCGYVYEGENAPEVCPICKASSDKFTKQAEGMSWAAEHVVGVAKGVSEDILADLRANFEGECSEVGMYQVNLILLNVQKLLTLTQSMIQFMRWLATRQDTEKHSRDFLKDTSAKNKLMKRRACTALRFLF